MTGAGSELEEKSMRGASIRDLAPADDADDDAVTTPPDTGDVFLMAP